RDIPVFGPIVHPIAGVNRALRGGERISIDPLGSAFEVWHTPGHTLDHLIYVGSGRIFCGDTLFAAGCGRLFEGTAAQMFDSLERVSGLPDATRIHCAHEYTVANLRFAQAVEPDNEDIAARIEREAERRARGEPTLPSTLALERATNPFLRCHVPAVRERVQSARGIEVCSPLDTFIALRQWKDEFR
ncbi:MAG: hydroxyacylglutathione hydrolase, partial [Casimicrobiaceae bacterium]